MKAYYHARAREYDDWWLQCGLYAPRSSPGWTEERDLALRTIAALPSKRTLDVACGTGFVTRFLPGEVVGLDQSATYVEGDGLELPFEDGSFERVFTSHFYGHLEEDGRVRFLAEARRVASELVVFDAALHGGSERHEFQERVLNDGTRWTVYKRFFTGHSLLAELGDGSILHEGRWFVLVAAP